MDTKEKEAWEEKQSVKIELLYKQAGELWDDATWCMDHENNISKAIGAFHDLQHKAYYLKRALIELKNFRKYGTRNTDATTK